MSPRSRAGPGEPLENLERLPISFEIPLRTYNPLNGSHGHWSVVAKRRKVERFATRVAMCMATEAHRGEAFAAMANAKAWIITLTRIAPSRGLDSDALPASMKAIRDQIATELGFLDDSDPRLTWRYEQLRRNPREYAVCVTLEAR